MFYERVNESAEYIRENMGDDGIRDSALYSLFADFMLERINIIYK